MGQRDIRDLTRAIPFAPFRIVCMDGTVYQITHPDLAMSARRTVHVSREAREGRQPEEGTDIVSYFNIQRLETIETETVER